MVRVITIMLTKWWVASGDASQDGDKRKGDINGKNQNDFRRGKKQYKKR